MNRATALKILGFDGVASEEQIKKRKRKLLAVHHPDAGGNQRLYHEIQQAADVLLNGEKPAYSIAHTERLVRCATHNKFYNVTLHALEDKIELGKSEQVFGWPTAQQDTTFRAGDKGLGLPLHNSGMYDGCPWCQSEQILVCSCGEWTCFDPNQEEATCGGCGASTPVNKLGKATMQSPKLEHQQVKRLR